MHLEEAMYLEELKKQLKKSELYTCYHKAMWKLRHMLHKSFLVDNTSIEHSFATEVIYRIMEESSSYLANLLQGTFFASNHNTRALLELYAIVEYALSATGKKNKFLERFHYFPDLTFHKVFHQHDDAVLKCSEGVFRELFSEYAELKPEIFEAFGTKNKEELLKLETWRGNAKISNLFGECPKPEIVKSEYKKLCLFAHVSSICRRSKSGVFPKFCRTAETMLLVTVRYAAFSYVRIKQENIFNPLVQDKLDDIFLPLAPILVKAHADRGFIIGSEE